MLYGLSCRDDSGVEDILVADLADKIIAFADQAINA
jgi:hypothetical protein